MGIRKWEVAASMRFVWLWGVVTCLAAAVSLAAVLSLVEAESGTAPMVTVGTAGNPPTSAAITATTAEMTTPIADPPSNPPHVPRRGGESGEGDDDED